VTTAPTETGYPIADDSGDWRIYRGSGHPFDDIGRLPPPPPWRRFAGSPVRHQPAETDAIAAQRAHGYHITDDAIEMVNAALYLRRPLLVTGKPGTGKSTLAYSIAHELMLGAVIYWPITSRSKLQDGLYRYDAIGRLQEANLAGATAEDERPAAPDIGRYVTLGPLGSALLPSDRPRVLLIDELDKSDIDLPNDLLNVLEEGRFDIPELARLPEEQSLVEVATVDRDRVTVNRGEIRCNSFPIIVITSNAEREFPPAFLRRCVRLDIRPPDELALTRIVESLLGPAALERTSDLVDRFLDLRERGEVATDQLLNAIYLVTAGIEPPEATRTRLRASLIRDLNAASMT
jgi:MoxR-like ATPase